jgi:stage IV sporulation protein FB
VRGSIHIATVFGIPVRLHWMFLLMPYVLLSAFTPAGAAFLLIGGFGSVFLHELGHSLMARRFGIRVLDITFWPLGGMARMSEMPESPRIEGLVAFAGPAVNFVLAAIAVAAIPLFGLAGLDAGARVASWFAVINVLMGVFNLVPAFPMDGGRILRAFLGRTTDWVTATEQAVAVGRFIAGTMLVLSIALFFTTYQFCLLPLVAIFVWFAGSRELMAVRMRHGQSPFGDLGRTRPFAASAEWFQEPPREPAPQRPEPDQGDARRPSDWDVRPARGGLTEEDVRALERYRGRLRQPRDEDDPA